jgi:hypothetical protein
MTLVSSINLYWVNMIDILGSLIVFLFWKKTLIFFKNILLGINNETKQ